MRKRYIAISLIAIAISGCSALTLHQATESISARRDTSEKQETKVIETGSPPLVSKSTTINVESEGAVNIHTPASTPTADGNVLNAELLKALAEIRNHRNTDQTSTFKESVEVNFYKKMTALGGVFFILVAGACLMMVRALKLGRLEITKWGFDPKTVGYSANKMMKILHDVGDLMTRENSSLVNHLTDRNISDDAAAQINRQLIKLNEMKKIVEKAENIQRTSYGSRD